MKNGKNKIAKGTLISISTLAGIGFACVGVGCYFKIAKVNNIISNNTTNNNISGNENKPVAPPDTTTPSVPEPEQSIPETPNIPPIDQNPSEPQQPTPPTIKPDVSVQNMQFTIDITKTSGFKFSEVISFDVFDANTGAKLISAIDDFEDDNDGIIRLELPENGRYKIKLTEYDGVPSLRRTKYNYPDEVIFDKNTPNVRFQFEPVIEDYEDGKTYKIDDVARELWVGEDVLGQPISLRQNAREGKMTVLMHMWTNCENSKATLRALNKAIFWPTTGNMIDENKEIIKHVEVICFSDYYGDSLDTLRHFQENEYPYFHFVKDEGSKFVNSYFPNNNAYPRTAILDWQGVLVYRFSSGKVSNQTAFEKYIPKYSKNGEQ